MVIEPLKHNKVYFRNLDSIRFIAALMVFLGHVVFVSYKYLNIKDTLFARFLYAISDGTIGVSIFFVLSGFLITYLILSEIEFTGKFSLKNFYIRRILRIWPLYFVVVFIAFVLFPYVAFLLNIHINKGVGVLDQLIFLGNFDVMNIEKFHTGTDIMMQNITWSVAIEEQFYAFWPLIFLFLPRKFILPAIISVIMVSLVFRFCNSNDDILLYFHTLAVMVDMAIGALFAYAIVASKKVRSFFQQTSTYTILASFILFFFSVMYQDVLFASKVGAFIARPYFAVLFAFIIASQSMVSKPSVLELGNIKFADKLGKYTYGIYLLHPIVAETVHIAVRGLKIHNDGFVPLIIEGIFEFILTVFVSWLSYEYFEKRFLRLKKKFTLIPEE